MTGITAERWAEIEERWPAERRTGAFLVDHERDEENIRLLIDEVKRLQRMTEYLADKLQGDTTEQWLARAARAAEVSG